MSVWTGTIGSWDARSAGLGGWTLSPHHAYDPNSRVLFKGNGERRSASELPEAIERFAGGLDTYVDGGVASDVRLDLIPADVAFSPDGTAYISGFDFTALSFIYRVNLDGTIEILAGGGSSVGRWPRDEPPHHRIPDVAVGPDGAVYFSDDFSHKIWRVSASGQATTYAGNGVVGTTGRWRACHSGKSPQSRRPGFCV